MKNFRELGKYFKLNSIRRIVILGATAFAAVLAIVLGSVFYTANASNVKKSGEYSSTAEFSIKVDQPTDAKISLDQVADEIYNRIDPLGLNGAKVSSYSENGDDYVKVFYPNIESSGQANDIAYSITHKPRLTLTSMNNNQPIFNSHGDIDNSLSSGATT